MPTILFLFGLRFFFYSEEHLPMHIHVKNGDGKAKINIETTEVVENKMASNRPILKRRWKL